MINNITFTGRETMLVNATRCAAQTAARQAEERAAIKAQTELLEREVVKASSVLPEIPYRDIYSYVAYDIPVRIGKKVNQVA